MSDVPVVIVGGGLAGLACAAKLRSAGVGCLVLEASDAPGGRARTDAHEGFLLDRGFQVLLTSYPELTTQLDVPALDLCTFEPGALVATEGSLYRVADPWRRPGAALQAALAPVGRIADKLRIGVLRLATAGRPWQDVFKRPEVSMRERFLEHGFTPRMRKRFLRPFFGGIFLDPELEGSSRMMEHLFGLFSAGSAAVPRLGMGQLANQLAGRLGEGGLRCSSPVEALTADGVRLRGGEELRAEQVVLAIPGPAASRLVATAPEAARLLAGPKEARPEGLACRRGWKGVTCLYFAGDGEPPTREPILVLDGEGGERGPILNLAIMSNVSPAYAPPGRFLVSVTVPGVGDEGHDGVLRSQVYRQLEHWFPGAAPQRWEHLRTYRIAEALPDQRPPWYTVPDWEVRLDERLFRCGDWVGTASIDGALRSARLAAAAVLERRARG